MNIVKFRKPDPTPRRPLAIPVPIWNPFTRLLFWASKTDPRLIAVCSRWARITQASLGGLVLCTSAFNFGALYYSLTTLNASPAWAPWLALLWGCFIFLFDREIAGSLDKGSVIIRPLLAGMIGLTLSIPVELWIFASRVDQNLQRQYLQENREVLQRRRAAEAALDQRREALAATLNELRRQEASWGKVMDEELVGRQEFGRTGSGGDGPVFKNAQHQQMAVRQQIADIGRELQELDGQEAQSRIDQRLQRDEIPKVRDFATRYEELDRLVHSSSPLYRLSWGITLLFVVVDMSVALLKLFTPHVDYHHLVNAEIRENKKRIDEIAQVNHRRTMEDPEAPELSVSEKFTIARFWGAPDQLASYRPSPIGNRSQRVGTPSEGYQEGPPVTAAGFDQAYLDKLCDSVLHLFGNIPRPTILITPASAVDHNNAQCISPGSTAEPCTIEFNDEYLHSASQRAVINTMKHELIHAWIHHQSITDTDQHGQVFILKGKEVGCDVQQYERERHLKDRYRVIPLDSQSSNEKIRYERFIAGEVAALETAIRLQAAAVKSLRATYRNDHFAETKLFELEQCWREIQEPLAIPSTFVDVERKVRDVLGEIRRATHAIAEARKPEKKSLHTEQCVSLVLYRQCVWALRLQERRVQLLPEFLREAALWDRERLEKELERREDERDANHPLSICRLRVFTTDNLLIESDPSDTAGPFLTGLVFELRTLLDRFQSDGDSLLSAVVQQVAVEIDTVIGLQAKCEEMKRLYPRDLHPMIDRLFRLHIDKLRERE